MCVCVCVCARCFFLNLKHDILFTYRALAQSFVRLLQLRYFRCVYTIGVTVETAIEAAANHLRRLYDNLRHENH